MSKELERLFFVIVGCTTSFITILVIAVFIAHRYHEKNSGYYHIPVNSDVYHVKVETLEKALADSQQALSDLKKINQKNVDKFNSYVNREDNFVSKVNQDLNSCQSQLSSVKKERDKLKSKLKP